MVVTEVGRLISVNPVLAKADAPISFRAEVKDREASLVQPEKALAVRSDIVGTLHRCQRGTVLKSRLPYRSQRGRQREHL